VHLWLYSSHRSTQTPGGRATLPPVGEGSDWAFEQVRGSAGALHALDPLAEAGGRRLAVVEVDRPALVLGSTQSDDVVDRDAADAAGVELVRRRSGGGAVLLVPGDSLWVEVLLPRTDPLWDDDVSRASLWVGRAWAAALDDLGLPATVHEAGLVRTRWSGLVCFAGWGPGEVSVGGRRRRRRKAVGVASRRTRAGARFQCGLGRTWDPGPLLDLLALDPRERVEGRRDLASAAIGVDRPAGEVVGAFRTHLP
jgi:lipoate-protein ligase A